MTLPKPRCHYEELGQLPMKASDETTQIWNPLRRLERTSCWSTTHLTWFLTLPHITPYQTFDRQNSARISGFTLPVAEAFTEGSFLSPFTTTTHGSSFIPISFGFQLF